MRTLFLATIALLFFSCGQKSQSENAQTKRANLDSLRSVVQGFDNKAMTAELNSRDFFSRLPRISPILLLAWYIRTHCHTKHKAQLLFRLGLQW